MQARTLRGGYFYALDVRAALDPRRSRRYVDAAVRRALAEPASARNATRRRSLSALERQRRAAGTAGTSEASRAATELLRSSIGSKPRGP